MTHDRRQRETTKTDHNYTLYRTGNKGIWQARFKLRRGKRITRSLGTEDEEAAKKYAEKLAKDYGLIPLEGIELVRSLLPYRCDNLPMSVTNE